MPSVVVTCEPAGVGRARVRRLAQDAAKIDRAARGRERLQAPADEARAAGGEARLPPLAVSDEVAPVAAAGVVETAPGLADRSRPAPDGRA